jgi:hypothetical protein
MALDVSIHGLGSNVSGFIISQNIIVESLWKNKVTYFMVARKETEKSQE